MKRYIKNTIILSVAGALVLSCDSANKTVDDVFDEVTRGAVFRATSSAADISGQTFDFSDESSEYSVSFEVEDNAQGGLLEDVDVYVSFTNATDEDASLDEVLVETLDASMFTTNESGLPAITYTVSLGELSTALGLAPGDYTGGDSFTLRYVLNLTDGRAFSNNNLNSTVSGGSYYRSPFIYTVPLVCPPIEPTPGEWQLELQDSYGDSWNGASLTVTLDGVSTNYSHEGGASTSHTFTVPSGTGSIQITYNGGSYDEENTFQVTSANGETVLDLGPTPPAGTLLFDFCLPLDL
ncbi:MAG: hypothetical protein V7724_00330 [Sediminicola sp.]|tara:strand:- start:106852 stop:107736 length:885 start_codon:yes stop_codon:yes gene_type:complete